MRVTFIETLCALAEADPRIVLLTGDLGYSALERFRDRFPTRFFNVGVAEQNLVGIATGLAEAGFMPFVYSIATFATMRAYEFVRNGPVLHGLPVRIVGVGSGFEYGQLGPTHYALEDLAIMRVHPGLTVVAPADYEQARMALLKTWDLPTPIYYRLGKDETTIVPGLAGRFELGKPAMLRTGGEVVFLATGRIAIEAIHAAEELGRLGVDTGVAVVSTLNPPHDENLAALISGVPLVVTLEAHYSRGGLGSLVAEVLAARGTPTRLVRAGVERAPAGLLGSERWQSKAHGLDAESLVRRVLGVLPARIALKNDDSSPS